MRGVWPLRLETAMTSPELRGPLHLFHCFIELGKLAIAEKLNNLGEWMDDAMNVDFGGEDE